MDLTSKTCVPCRAGAPKLSGDKLVEYKRAINPAWELYDANTKLRREFVFGDFREAMAFVNRMADVAESEGHHPDMYIHSYKRVRLELWTHKINGLHENDFILAAKADALFP